MTKTKTDSNQVSIHQHQDYTVKWHQIQNSKQKWIVIKRPFLVEINGHGIICNKLGVVGKGLKGVVYRACSKMVRETTLSCIGCEAETDRASDRRNVASSSSGTIISCSVLWSCSIILHSLVPRPSFG